MRKRTLTTADKAAFRNLAKAAVEPRQVQEAEERETPRQQSATELRRESSRQPRTGQDAAERGCGMTADPRSTWTMPTAQATPGGRTTTTPGGIAHAAPGTPAGIQPELLTTAEAAQLTRFGERTLWRWSHSGLAPQPLKIGIGPRPAVRYRRSELMAWIEGGCKPVDGRAA